MEVTSASIALVIISQTSEIHAPEDLNCHQKFHENLNITVKGFQISVLDCLISVLDYLPL
jgi:hypothetical protein